MIDSIVDLWWAWMAPMFWQVALLVVIVGVIDVLIRRWVWPQVRHALWLLVLVKLFIPPGWSHPAGIVPVFLEPLAGPVWMLQGDQPRVEETAVFKNSTGENIPWQSPARGTPPAPSESIGAEIETFDMRFEFFVIWLVGVGVFGTVLVTRMRRLARWHREQEHKPRIPQWFYDTMVEAAERLDLDRLPAIVFSDEAVTPAVYGLWRPVMVLPAHYTDELTPEEAEHVVLHELAHLKRGDLFVHGVVLAVQVLYWFNPFVAFARRQIKHVRELCCDLTVASVLEEKTQAYRQTLLDTARVLLSESVQPSLGLLGVFEEPYKLVARIRWLEKPTWRRHRLMVASSWIVVLLAGPVFLPMAAGISELDNQESVVISPDNKPSTSRKIVESEVSSQVFHHVRNEFRIDTHVLGFKVDSRSVAKTEMWVGESMIAGTERGRTTIVDLSRQQLTLIDHEAGVWVKTHLPLDLRSFLTEEALQQHRTMRTTGTVVDTGNSRRILGRKCAAFDVESWRTSGGGEIIDPNTYTVWSTTDVPFDERLFEALLLNLRLIYNRDEQFRSELAKVRGLQMRLEGKQGNFFKSQRFIDEVVELKEAVPPDGTFEAPASYQRVERLQSMSR